MLLKICGLTREKDIEIVNRYLPDYIGFVFAKSKRHVNLEEAKKLAIMLNPMIKSVGVFVDSPEQEVSTIARECNLNAVQLHGNEDEKYLLTLRGLLPKSTQIIKAIRVKDIESVKATANLPCDLLLFDTYCENTTGGSGKTFNWELLKSATDIKKPYFLAGGLNSENILSATQELNLYAVDISSGVETDGVKDERKICEIIKKVRKC
jgi:phosphoribosylanthranilate isomerase